MNILIIGTGMYVCGRGTKDCGTILPAIYEYKKMGHPVNLFIAGTGGGSINALDKKIRKLNTLFGVEILPEYFSGKGEKDPEAYKAALQKMPSPGCAIVVVPDILHRKIAGDTITSGLHTLVVKPLAPTVKEVYELMELQKRHNVYCAVEFHKRLDRSNLKLKDVIQNGSIGSPLYFLVEYSQRKSIPTDFFKDWVESVDIFQYLGIHYVDMVYFVTGATPKRLIATGQKSYLLSKGIDTFDSIQAHVEWQMPKGELFTSSFFTNWIDPETTSAMSDQKIKVIGTKGRFEADQKRRGIVLARDEGEGIEEPNPDFCAAYGNIPGEISFKGYGIDSILQFLSDTSRVERGTVTPENLESKRPTFKNSVIPTTVIEAAKKSLNENGKWVRIIFDDDKFLKFE